MLAWFSEHENARRHNSIEDVYKSVCKRHPGRQLAIDMSGITNACLNKLVRDGYVECIEIDFHDLDEGTSTKVKRFMITFEGLFFSENGGYKALRKKEASKQQLRLLERFVLVLGTLAAGIAGIDYLISDEVTRSIVVSIFLSSLAALIMPILSSLLKKI